MELKRGDHARVQTEMVEFIAIPFPLCRVQGQLKKRTKKRDALAELLFWSFNLYYCLFDVLLGVAVAVSYGP